MMTAATAKKIRNVLGGLGAGAAPNVVTVTMADGTRAKVPQQVARQYGYASPGIVPPSSNAPPPGASASELADRMEQLRRSQAAQVSFYDQIRRFRPDAAQIFEMEQERARAERGETSSNVNEPTGYYGGETSETFDQSESSEMETVDIAAVAENPRHAARLQFIAWLQENEPELYAEALRRLGIGSMGQTTAEEKPPLWERITGILTGLYSAKAQADLVETNIKRAEQNLPPIDPVSVAPVVRTQVTMTPEMAADLKLGTQTALKYGLIAAAVIAGLYFMRK